MSMRIDHEEHDRLNRLMPPDLTIVTEFEIAIRADRDIGGEEVVALLTERFPYVSVSAPRVSHVFAEAS